MKEGVDPAVIGEILQLASSSARNHGEPATMLAYLDAYDSVLFRHGIDKSSDLVYYR